MSRRSYCLAGGLFGLLMCGVVAVGLLLLRYEPQHYARAPLTPERCEQCSRDCFTKIVLLCNEISNGDPQWAEQFTDEELNSYLNNGFRQQGLEHLMPEGISEPRVVFEPGRIRLAFRYRNALLNTVVSMDARVWLAGGDPNVVALQLEAFRAGVLPISAQWLLERLSEGCRKTGIDVNWYRHEGHPVALLRFQADQARPTLQLQGIKIEQGTITIHGRSTEDLPLRTQLELPDPLRPAFN